MFLSLILLTSLFLEEVECFVPSATRKFIRSSSKSRHVDTSNALSLSTSVLDSITTSSVLDEVPTDSKQFSWTKQWYPVAVEEYTTKSKINKFMLLGNDIILWHDGLKWSAFEDSCPHRGVPLSEGRVEKNGELLCAYHAWTFDSQGECTSIPQTLTKEKEKALLPSACVYSYPTQVAQGLIWVWGEKGKPGSDVSIEATLKSPRLIEELSDPHYADRIGPITWNFRDLPYGWDMFMENVLDPAHVVVSHHGIVGNRYNDTQPINMIRSKSRSELSTAEGGELNPAYPEDAGFKYFVKNNLASNDTESSNDFRPPSLNKIETAYQNDNGKLILALYATPTKPGFCRHIGAQILIKNKEGKYPAGLGLFALPMPKWLLHITASFFLHQDAVFLHHQERMLYSSSNYAFGDFSEISNTEKAKGSSTPLTTSDFKAYSKTYFMPNVHDKQITHLRQWIAKRAGGGVKWGAAAVALGLPTRLRANELFDVYHSHTENCSHCSTALRNIKNIRNVSLVLAIISLSVAKKLSIKFGLGSVFGAIALVTHTIKKLFYNFEFSHQNNN